MSSRYCHWHPGGIHTFRRCADLINSLLTTVGMVGTQEEKNCWLITLTESTEMAQKQHYWKDAVNRRAGAGASINMWQGSGVGRSPGIRTDQQQYPSRTGRIPQLCCGISNGQLFLFCLALSFSSFHFLSCPFFLPSFPFCEVL